VARWDDAEVTARKIVDYLLAVEHPTGGDKAAFFIALGYTQHEWSRLREDLIAAARGGDVVSEQETAFGIKSVIDGLIVTPKGRRIALRTVWIQDDPQGAPRLVTAYPRKGGAGDVQGA
jgi:hypothetical protein